MRSSVHASFIENGGTQCTNICHVLLVSSATCTLLACTIHLVIAAGFCWKEWVQE